MDVFLAKRRPPPHIRPDLDISYRLSDQSVEILEIRPQWNDRTIIREHPIAKATYVKTQKLCKSLLAASRHEMARLRADPDGAIHR